MIVQGKLEVLSRWKIGVVTARFNEEITYKLEDGALARLRELGATAEQIVAVRVPGAVEVPLAAKILFDRGCDAVIALGAVIQGDTKHFDYVCASVERGCTTLALTVGKPVIFGILTTDDEEQAFERVGGSHGHKGRDAAEAAVEMISLSELL